MSEFERSIQYSIDSDLIFFPNDNDGNFPEGVLVRIKH
ncbi:bacteriocin immunity protein [Xenorhabdus sp. 12]|uniref:Bacteriocin immunity protein n=1 Tax=Xenorhabdus santafensis TaxID=2582833 RepID=A0ABU4S9X4_9GAMM|nr:bacteriocin immunity protein [Xenorhabdus sp. 12]